MSSTPSTTKAGRSLQDCLTSLKESVKRPKRGERLSPTKRQRILEEQLPIVLKLGHRRKREEQKVESKKETQNDAEQSTQGDTATTADDTYSSVDEMDQVELDFLEYIKQQKLALEQDMERLKEKRTTFFTKQSDLVGVYMFGLERIAQLTDVRDAPDAILPGNQP